MLTNPLQSKDRPGPLNPHADMMLYVRAAQADEREMNRQI